MIIKPGEPGWFGMNKHHETTKVTQVVDEILGVPRGTTVEHGSGRVDVHVRPDRVELNADQAEGLFGADLNSIRERFYAQMREDGLSEREALKRLGGRSLRV